MRRRRSQLHLGQMSRPHLIQVTLTHLPRKFTRRAEEGFVDVLGVFSVGKFEYMIIRFVDYPDGLRRVTYGGISEHRQLDGTYRFRASQIDSVPWGDWIPGVYPSDRERGMRRASRQVHGRRQDAEVRGTSSTVASGENTDLDPRGKSVHEKTVQHRHVRRRHRKLDYQGGRGP